MTTESKNTADAKSASDAEATSNDEAKVDDEAQAPGVIETSVDADVLSLDAELALLTAKRAGLAARQTEERAAKQLAKFDEIVGGPSAILKATSINLDALKAIGVTGFILQVKPDPEGGADVVSVAPVTSAPAKTKATAKKSGGTQRDLQGNFDSNATADEKAAMAVIDADGGDGNKVYSLRLKVWNRVHAE